MDRAFKWRRPVQDAWGSVWSGGGGRKLLEEVIIRRANALPACREAAFHPVAAAGHMGKDEPVPDAPFGGSGFKQGREALLMAGKWLVYAKLLPDRACAARILRWAYPLDNRLKNRRKRMWAAQGRRPGSAVCGRVWPVRCFLCSGRKQPRFPRCPEQAPRAAWHTLCFTGIADMPCPV